MPATTKDPVCGMTVDPATPKATADHDGARYFFCCAGCAEKFRANPSQYLTRPEIQPPNSSPQLGMTAIPAAAAVPIDPVCGMGVDPSRAVRVAYGGWDHFLCSPHCADKFRANPAAYLKPVLSPPTSDAQRLTTAMRAAGQYTCPMHPEIVRDQPGPCPICGMALEPATVSSAQDDTELRQMSRRFWWSVLLGAPLAVIAMGGMLPAFPLHHWLGMGAIHWMEFALATPIVAWGAWPFFQRAWTSVLNRRANMFTLIGLGIAAAYLYSAVATVVPGILPETF